MKTHKTLFATLSSLARAAIALLVIALGITGIAALISDTELSLDFVFGSQTWLVWLGTSVLLLAVFAALVTQMIKPAFRYRRDRFGYRHC